MNSKKCKQLRKLIYGDLAQRIRNYTKLSTNQIINTPGSPRAVYLSAKVSYKKRRQTN